MGGTEKVKNKKFPNFVDSLASEDHSSMEARLQNIFYRHGKELEGWYENII